MATKNCFNEVLRDMQFKLSAVIPWAISTGELTDFTQRTEGLTPFSGSKSGVTSHCGAKGAILKRLERGYKKEEKER